VPEPATASEDDLAGVVVGRAGSNPRVPWLDADIPVAELLESVLGRMGAGGALAAE